MNREETLLSNIGCLLQELEELTENDERLIAIQTAMQVFQTTIEDMYFNKESE